MTTISTNVISSARITRIKANAKMLIKAFGYTQLDDIAEDDFIELLLESVIQNILNYCNITKFPTELDYVAAKRLAGEYLNAKNSIGIKGAGVNDGAADGSAFKKITQGDTTVEKFGSDSNSLDSKLKTAIADLRNYGLGEVAHFKCLKW